MPFTSFGTHYWFPQNPEDREGISQVFECRHGECTCKFKNLMTLRAHMKKHKHFFSKNGHREARKKIIAFENKITRDEFKDFGRCGETTMIHS